MCLSGTISGMKLKAYLTATGTSMTAFGKAIGRDHSAVSRFAHGVRPPPHSAMQKIYVATNGAVTPNDFFDLSPAHENDSSDRDEHAA